MAKAKNRKPDLRRIRPTKTYTLPDIALTLGRGTATVRRWVGSGLPTLDDQKPALILGADLLTWLKLRWDARKHKCAPNQMYCMRCRMPRKAKIGSVVPHPRNEKTTTIKARCQSCGTRMNKACAQSKTEEFVAILCRPTASMQRLDGCSKPGVRHTSRRLTSKGSKYRDQVEQISMDFDEATGGETSTHFAKEVGRTERTEPSQKDIPETNASSSATSSS